MAWERDLGEAIKDELWKQVVSKWHTCVREIQSELINYKIFNRCYWTPSRMARLKLRDDGLCWRFNTDIGTMVHMLYECDKVKELWEKIVQFVNNIFSLTLHKNPALCMLGILPEDACLSWQQRQWCRLAMVSGCRVILRHWKSVTPSSFDEWLELMSNIASYMNV